MSVVLDAARQQPSAAPSPAVLQDLAGKAPVVTGAAGGSAIAVVMAVTQEDVVQIVNPIEPFQFDAGRQPFVVSHGWFMQ